jgi:hypothetical protein
MTAHEALARCCATWVHDPAREPCLPLCTDCRAAMVQEFASLCRPVEGHHREDLGRLYGFTFTDGPVETCGLHPWLHGEVSCP